MVTPFERTTQRASRYEEIFVAVLLLVAPFCAIVFRHALSGEEGLCLIGGVLILWRARVS